MNLFEYAVLTLARMRASMREAKEREAEAAAQLESDPLYQEYKARQAARKALAPHVDLAEKVVKEMAIEAYNDGLQGDRWPAKGVTVKLFTVCEHETAADTAWAVDHMPQALRPDPAKAAEIVQALRDAGRPDLLTVDLPALELGCAKMADGQVPFRRRKVPRVELAANLAFWMLRGNEVH